MEVRNGARRILGYCKDAVQEMKEGEPTVIAHAAVRREGCG
jgi:hypothetical protein